MMSILSKKPPAPPRLSSLVASGCHPGRPLSARYRDGIYELRCACGVLVHRIELAAAVQRLREQAVPAAPLLRDCTDQHADNVRARSVH